MAAPSTVTIVDDGGTTDSGGGTDARRDAPPPPPDGGTNACPKPGDVSSFTPPTAVHKYNAPAQKCTNAQIQGFYTNCVDSAATNMTCTNWTNMGADAAGSNKDCGACVYTQSTANSYGPVVG